MSRHAGRGARLALLCASVAIGVCIVEGGLRMLTRTDATGAQRIRGVTLLPVRLPLDAVASPTGEGGPEQSSYVRADADLGWTIRASGRSRDGLYQADTAGLRVEHAGSTVPRTRRPRTTRIAVFGDSFVHGNEVAFSQTWGAVLEATLRSEGPTEVLNFGVGGYGMDQALLRWRELGRGYAPDLVLVGLQPENVLRNLNLVRPLYFPSTGLPFSKPRFVLRDGALAAINRPALPPEALPALLRRFESWEHARHEYFYREQDLRWRPVYTSRIARYLLSRAPRRPAVDAMLDPGTPAGALALAILDAFADEVAGAGAAFAIVVLPRREEVRAAREGPGLRALLDRLRARFVVIDPTPSLRAGSEAIFARSHYNGAGNRHVARVVAAQLRREGLLARR